MTTRRKAAGARLRIIQVHSQIGNQERVKRVLTEASVSGGSDRRWCCPTTPTPAA